MVKKKTTPSKKPIRRASGTDEDVPVTTSLPPKINGQLRCYLKVKVALITWLVPNAPDVTHVRLLFWGEEGKGALFRPFDGKSEAKLLARTTARYGVRSGPRQFVEYLNDMGTLVFEVLSGDKMVLVGRAQVDSIGTLTASRPITGTFPVLSADSEKVAELKVSISINPIMTSYETASSVPTPDLSSDFYGGADYNVPPINAPRVIPAPQNFQFDAITNGDMFQSPASQKMVSGRSTPSGVDAQLFANSGKMAEPNDIFQSSDYADDPRKAPSAAISIAPATGLRKAASLESRQLDAGGYLSRTTKPGRMGPASADGQDLLRKAKTQIVNSARKEKIRETKEDVEGASELKQRRGLKNPENGKNFVRETETQDLLTTLITKGSKLRNEMIISALDPVMSDKENGSASGKIRGSIPLSFEPSSNHLDVMSVSLRPPDHQLIDSEPSDAENQILDFIVGDDEKFKAISALIASPVLSLSDDDQRLEMSDTDDPIHDANLLDDLIYKSDSGDESELLDIGGSSPIRHRSRSRSASSVNSLNDAGNMRPPSRHSSASGSGRNTPAKLCLHSQKSPKNVPRKSKKLTKGRLRKRSRSKEMRRRQEESDSDATNASVRSEGSRVSFDPTPSDSELNSSSSGRRGRSQDANGLSVQRYTLLGRIQKARVTVDNYVLTNDALSDSATKNRGNAGIRGKPPTPNSRRKSTQTYFVEYHFPVVATSRDKCEPNAMATEVVRVVSKKLEGKVVTFGQCSVFPVFFDAESLEKWWKSALVFKVYCRSGAQRVPDLLGMCSLPLKTVLKAKALFLSDTLEVKDRSKCSSLSKNGQESEWPTIGQLKISVELATDSKDLQMALAKAQLLEMKDPKIIPIVRSPLRPQRRAKENDGRSRRTHSSQGSSGPQNSSGTQTEPLPSYIHGLPFSRISEARVQNYHVPAPNSGISGPTPLLPQAVMNYSDSSESITLHTMLMVPEGIHVTLAAQPLATSPGMTQLTNLVAGHAFSAHNLYLVSRMFWSDDIYRSNVCWGTSNPKFDFVQMAPVLLTQSLLDRMQNNFMIIEVYDKKTSSQTDQLVGIVKLPLHQYYVSFRDRRISNALLKYPLPVIAVDGEMPIINLFTGSHHGYLKVVLVMGSFEQVTSLQRNRMGISPVVNHQQIQQFERIHLRNSNLPMLQYGQVDNLVEHLFEVVIEGVTGLQLFENMIFGEADCFLQYHFPSQTSASQSSDTAGVQSCTTLKAHRTNTTLCIQDPVFHHLSRHKIFLLTGSPVQREILSACAGVGGGVGGVLFELWFRYYSPNTREQIFAKALLPLAKLCAMVTMKKEGERSVQSFSLALTCVYSDGELQAGQEAHSRLLHCGSLDVTINYQTNVIRANGTLEGLLPTTRSLSGGTVCICISILRACGLKTAAVALARHDSLMKYPSEVGVNSYVRIRFSFLQKEDERLTRTVARSFAPDFSCTMDFPCPLLWTDPGSDAVSLAEILANAEAVFEVWHQLPGTKTDSANSLSSSEPITGRHIISTPSDILLGTVCVPLKSLIVCRTGLSGWQPICCAVPAWQITDRHDDNQSSVGHLERVVGGLEIKMAFAHENDLDSVLDAAHGVGWTPFEDGAWSPGHSGDESLDRFNSFTVAVDDVCFPLTNALFAGQEKMDPSATCYVKYRFYNKKAVVSKASPVEVKDGFVRAFLKHSKAYVISGSSVFFRYLREERLELEVMLTYNHDDGDKRSRSQDRKIGSAFIDLISLSYARDRQQRIRTTFPLFKPGASGLGGACLTAHITIKPCMTPNWYQSDEDVVDEAHSELKRTINKSETGYSVIGNNAYASIDMEKVFPVHISIERAFHLPMVMDNKVGMEPSAYVSYQTAEKSDLTYTIIVPDTTTPVWCHEHDTYLSRDLLTHKDKNLTFKVWHKPKDFEQVPNKCVDQVLGFVAVDLSCLKSFGSVCGCYNVIDMKGVCRGQLQVAIVPGQAAMNSSLDDLDLNQLPLCASTTFVPGNTIWCSQTYQQLSLPVRQLFSGAPENGETAKFHNSLIQKVIENLKNVDMKILALSKPHSESQDEATAPESEAMPLSTSSMLMTFGSTTIGTNTWGPLTSLPIKEYPVDNGIINVAATYVKNLDGADGMSSSADSTTKDTMAQLLKQTLEKTGSTIVSFAVADNGETEANGRNDGRTYGDELGSDFSTTLKHAQMLIQQFQPLVDRVNDGCDNTPITIEADDQSILNDRVLEEEDGHDGHGVRSNTEQLEVDGLHRNLVAGCHQDSVDNVEGSDFEEEDTFSNIWAMRSSQRRSSEGSLDLTIEPDTDSVYVEPRVLNDISILNIRAKTNFKPGTTSLQKPVSEEAERESTISSDTMFMDSRDADVTEAWINAEEENGSQSQMTLKNSCELNGGETSNSQKNSNLERSSKVQSYVDEVPHEEASQGGRTEVLPKNRSWKAAMQRRELQRREHEGSSESENDDVQFKFPARFQKRNQGPRDRISCNTGPSKQNANSSDTGKKVGALEPKGILPDSCIGGDSLPSNCVAPVDRLQDPIRRQSGPKDRKIGSISQGNQQKSTLGQELNGEGENAAADVQLVKETVSKHDLLVTSKIPNYFLPPADLAKSMQQICHAEIRHAEIGQPSVGVDREAIGEEEAAEKAQLFNSFKKTNTTKRITTNAKNMLPAAETLQRIAKIFDKKFTT